MLIAVRFALHFDLTLACGVPLFALYTLRGAERRTSPILSPAAIVTLSLTGAALAVFGFLLLAATISDTPVTALDHETLVVLLNETAIGAAAKIRVAALLAMVPLSFALRGRPGLLSAIQSLLGAIALCSLAWTGHGAAGDGAAPLAHLVSDLLHMLAAAVWFGALAGLLVLLRRAHRPICGAQTAALYLHRRESEHLRRATRRPQSHFPAPIRTPALRPALHNGRTDSAEQLQTTLAPTPPRGLQQRDNPMPPDEDRP